MLDQRQALADALSPRPGASPGLMRRRYSMPETIMRKYRLAQLRSDSDDSEPATAPSRAASPASLSPARGSCASLCEPPAHRFIRRDRELMRKSALLRRLWGGGKQPLTGSNNELAPCVCSCDARYCSDKDLYDSHIEYGRESKSLDGSRSELRHASVGYPKASRARDSHPPAGWATPKRQRLDSPSGLNSSDEMLRTAMRNSYDRAEEHRHEKEKREESTSDSTFQSHGRDVSSVITSDGSRFTETPESADAAKPRKRRQSVCIYMNSLESPSAEIKSETVTATPEDTESLSISQSRTGEHTESSNSTFVTTEVTSTNHYSDSTGGFDTASTNEVHYRDSLETQTASSNEKSEDNQFSCIIKGDSVIENTEGAERLALVEKSPTKITESTTEILEIVVSETLNSTAFIDNTIVPALESNPNNTLKLPSQRKSDITKQKQHMDLDEYVSNILVESLNSLTDQIEEMNASMGGDRKISIVEKEIKVKLQNTGMNTIVHLSPTSNNPIIFGNEELYNKHEENDSSETATRKHSIGKDIIKLELTDNNDMRLTDSSETVTHYGENSLQFDKDNPSSLTTENLNQAVLQQIQKLFQDGLEQFDPKINYPGRMVPEISHIEISNVDVFIDDNSDPNYESNDKIEINTDRNSNFNCTPTNVSMTESALGEVGTGTYFPEQPGSALVPRFSAFPNTDSMEVNTSSSDDAEVIESDCTSLVDSLDDPNSPRSALLRRSYGNRRSELVRSAIDILDLLPDMADNDSKGNKEKNEAFFIRIRDNDCDCEKENVVVADHMPDKIKQRLYRRHKKRELRMQYAKRKKIRQIKCDIENQRQPDIMKSKKEVEKDCSAILKSLIDEVIMKIAEEEHKCMRIKQKIDNKKIEENVLTSTNKKPKSNRKVSDLSKLESFKITKNGEVHFCKGGNNDNVKKTSLNEDNYYKSSNKTHVRGKLYLQPHSPVTPDDYGPKRVYHKSEIHEGNKCIEILEILEYVESSQSSPDSTNSDENLNHKMKSRKSRIPIPIYERIHKIPRSKNIQKPYKNSSLGRSSPNLNMSENLGKFKMDALIANILIDAINDNVKEESSKELPKAQLVPVRRASVPQQDTHRGRSTSSLRFKQMFDIIPEEKSSLSVESSNEDINLNRRVSAPILTNKYSESNNNDTKHHGDKVKVNTASINNTSKLSKSTSTSPLGEEKIKVKSITTSPLRKSAATSPIIPPNGHEHGFEDNVLLKNGIKPTNTAKKSLSSHGTRDGWLGFYKPNKQSLEEEGVKYNSKEDIPIEKPAKDPKSAHIQYANTPQSTVRTIESEKYKQIIINHEKTKEKSQTPEPKHRKEDTRKPSLNAKETKRKKDKNKIDFFEKFKDKDTKSKRQTRLVHSLSDPQTRTDFVIKKTDTKKIQMISVEKSEEETFSSKALKLPAFKDKQLEVPGHSSSDSDSDSAKSLLCSLAPKWLSMGNGARQKRQMRKKASQEQQNQNNAGGWSVTVAGNCYTALPADVEMRLSFPKPPARQVASQSDSGFGEDNRTQRRPIAQSAQKSLRENNCQCKHCEDCTCPRNRSLEESYSSFLPPAHNRKMTLLMKKESSGSSIHACASVKKPSDSLPDVDTYKSRKSKSKNTVKAVVSDAAASLPTLLAARRRRPPTPKDE